MTDPAASAPRIEPLVPPYEPQVHESLMRWMPPGAAVEPLALFRTLYVHPDLASRMRPLGAGILGHGLVEERMRELMILRTCALCGAEYEWGVHVSAFSAAVGLTAEQCAATVEGGSQADLWDERERAVLRLAEELHASGGASDGLFEELRRSFEEPQVLELAVTAGWYHTISFVIGTARVQPEAWAARFPGAGASAEPG